MVSQFTVRKIHHLPNTKLTYCLYRTLYRKTLYYYIGIIYLHVIFYDDFRNHTVLRIRYKMLLYKIFFNYFVYIYKYIFYTYKPKTIIQISYNRSYCRRSYEYINCSIIDEWKLLYLTNDFNLKYKINKNCSY